MVVQLEPVVAQQRPDLSPTSTLKSAISPDAYVVERSDAIETDPSDFMLASLGDRRIRVKRPFEVTISRENEDFIAYAPEIDEFGFGASRQGALRDLQQAMVELYFSLNQDEERLGPDLRHILEILETKVTPAQLT